MGNKDWKRSKGKESGVEDGEEKEEVDCEPAGVVLTRNHWASETSKEKGIWTFVRLGLTAKGKTVSLNKA